MRRERLVGLASSSPRPGLPRPLVAAPPLGPMISSCEAYPLGLLGSLGNGPNYLSAAGLPAPPPSRSSLQPSQFRVWLLPVAPLWTSLFPPPPLPPARASGTGSGASVRTISSATATAASVSSSTTSFRRWDMSAARCTRSSSASVTLLMLTLSPDNLAQSLAFWPSLPIARDSWRSGTTTSAELFSKSISTRVNRTGAEGVSQEDRRVGVPLDYVDLLSLELIDDVLDPYSSQAYAGADGVNAVLAGVHGHLASRAWLARNGLYLHDAVEYLRHFHLEQATQEVFVGAGPLSPGRGCCGGTSATCTLSFWPGLYLSDMTCSDAGRTASGRPKSRVTWRESARCTVAVTISPSFRRTLRRQAPLRPLSAAVAPPAWRSERRFGLCSESQTQPPSHLPGAASFLRFLASVRLISLWESSTSAPRSSGCRVSPRRLPDSRRRRFPGPQERRPSCRRRPMQPQ